MVTKDRSYLRNVNKKDMSLTMYSRDITKSCDQTQNYAIFVDSPRSLSCTGSTLRNDGDLHSHGLKGGFISASPDPEVAILTPSVSPRVLHNPVLHTRALLHAIAHYQHHVIGDLQTIMSKGRKLFTTYEYNGLASGGEEAALSLNH